MPRRKRPILGTDYIMDDTGRAQFTKEYLLRRGTCCEHDCRFCPYPQHAASTSVEAKSYTQIMVAPKLACAGGA